MLNKKQKSYILHHLLTIGIFDIFINIFKNYKEKKIGKKNSILSFKVELGSRN